MREMIFQRMGARLNPRREPMLEALSPGRERTGEKVGRNLKQPVLTFWGPRGIFSFHVDGSRIRLFIFDEMLRNG